MQNIFSKINFFLLSLFVFLIPLQTVYIFRQGPIGQDGIAREGIWQFGTLALYATDILFFLIFIVACIRFFLCHSRENGNPDSKKDGVYGFLVCLLCIASLSVAWSPDKILALQSVFRLFEGVVIFFLFSRMSSVRWNTFAWLFIVGACIQSVFGAVQFFMQEIFAVPWLGISHHAPWILGDAVVESSEVRWLRAYGSFPHPNILATYLVAGYFFCMAIVSRSEKKSQTWLATLAGVCILFGLVLTFSREAWIGLAVGLAVMGIMGRSISMKTGSPIKSGMTEKKEEIRNMRISPLIFFFLVSFVTLIFSGLLFSEPLSVRFGIGGWKRLEVKSVEERVDSVKEFLSLGPTLVRGVGIGQYTKTLYQNDVKNNSVRSSYAYQPVHNVFLLVLAELGIAGLVAFIGFLFFLILRTCHLEWNEGSRGFQQRIVGFFASLRMTKISVAVLFSFIIISLFDHFFWTIHSGILLWWICMAGLDRK